MNVMSFNIIANAILPTSEVGCGGGGAGRCVQY
jgi:hypothetical protein